jgi:hypothetical protein
MSGSRQVTPADIRELIRAVSEADTAQENEVLEGIAGDIDQAAGDIQRAVSQLSDTLDDLGDGEDGLSTNFGPVDLNKNSWVWSEESDFTRPGVPDVQGTQEVAIFAESIPEDDNDFEIIIRFLDEQGKVVNEIDESVDQELASTSPTGTNHHVFVTVATASRYIDIEFRNTSGSTNRIQGNFNFH